MKKVITAIALLAWGFTCCAIEGSDVTAQHEAGMINEAGTAMEAGTIRETATVQTVITLSDGNQYVVDQYTTDATIRTYGKGPEDWEIVDY